ncbi:hypothetical protein B296_00039307 [Ensete ventricosum]|uniref:Uncharacterized protein n=1 Tax=Ensete ventricosum TaxID=4639 RepID=A0A426X4R2_ENSVE|nr:hypothetical protein B296_00039307 [Ensete ventricosum]
MWAGGILSRRSWIDRLSAAAFPSSSTAYLCCSSVNTTGSRPSPSLGPLPPTTSAAHANNPAIASLSLAKWSPL